MRRSDKHGIDMTVTQNQTYCRQYKFLYQLIVSNAIYQSYHPPAGHHLPFAMQTDAKQCAQIFRF